MDGVLVNAKEWHYDALNEALSIFGFNISREEHITIYDGLSTKSKLDILSEKKYFPKNLHTLTNKLKQKFTYKHFELLCEPSFEHEYALSNLKKNNYKMALCSNSIQETVDKFTHRINVQKYLEFYISSDQFKNGKPAPDIYNFAIKKLDVKPQDCLILEDNFNGIKAAKDAGAHVMQITNTSDVTYKNILNEIRMIESS